MEQNEPTRINKYLSEVGFCSRRAADKLIEQGRVRINGQVPEMGTKVQPGDVITVDDEPIGAPQEEFIYIAFNNQLVLYAPPTTSARKTTSLITSITLSVFFRSEG